MRVRVLVCIAACLGAVVGCSSADPVPPAPPRASSEPRADDAVLEASTETVVRASTYMPSHLISADATEPGSESLLAAIYSPLVRVTGNGKLEPLVAATLPTTPDGVTWTVPVAPGWTFHDGEPVTGKSFVDAWNFTINTIDYSSGGYWMRDIVGYDELVDDAAAVLSGVRLVDPMTIEIRLTAPDPTFAVDLAAMVFAPMSAHCLASPFSCETNPVGNGPFRVAAPWVVGDPLHLERFDEWGGGAPAAADRLEIHPGGYYIGITEAVRAKQIDLATLAPREVAMSTDGVGTATVPGRELTLLGFAPSDARFTDPAVRAAISMAIDRDALALVGGATAARELVPSNAVGHQNGPCGVRCEYDPAAAKAALDAAGGVSGPVRLTFRGGGAATAAFEALAAQLETNLGIDVELDDTHDDEVQSFGGTPADGLFEVSEWGEVSVATDFVEKWASVQQERFDSVGSLGDQLRYASSDVDDRLARAVTTPALVDSVALVQEAERAVLADLPATPLWFRADRWVLNSRLTGFDTGYEGAPRWELLDLAD